MPSGCHAHSVSKTAACFHKILSRLVLGASMVPTFWYIAKAHLHLTVNPRFVRNENLAKGHHPRQQHSYDAMRKYMQWVTALLLSFSLWALLCKYAADQVEDARVFQVVSMLPMYALVSFGAYSLAVIALSVMAVTDCPEAAKELDLQVKQAKADLRARGIKL